MLSLERGRSFDTAVRVVLHVARHKALSEACENPHINVAVGSLDQDEAENLVSPFSREAFIDFPEHVGLTTPP